MSGQAACMDWINLEDTAGVEQASIARKADPLIPKAIRGCRKTCVSPTTPIRTKRNGGMTSAPRNLPARKIRASNLIF